MREIDLDKFLGKYVEVKDYNYEISKGVLYKITNSHIVKDNISEWESLTPIKDGYFLDYLLNHRGCCYRKSHIKKIKEIDENERNSI